MSAASRRADAHAELDLADRRRVFACGDVHGRLDLLEAGLSAVGFGPDDFLLCTGDWVNRGPAGMDVDLFLNANPNVAWTKGNHEEMLSDAVADPEGDAARVLARNGGGWMKAGMEAGGSRAGQRLTALAARLAKAPAAMRVATPGGRRLGMAHADMVGNDWDTFARDLTSPDEATARAAAGTAMWSRDRIRRLRTDADANGPAFSVRGVDHVLFGHTIVPAPVTAGNCSWIDTGAYRTDTLTIIDVDAWIHERMR